MAEGGIDRSMEDEDYIDPSKISLSKNECGTPPESTIRNYEEDSSSTCTSISSPDTRNFGLIDRLHMVSRPARRCILVQFNIDQYLEEIEALTSLPALADWLYEHNLNFETERRYSLYWACICYPQQHRNIILKRMEMPMMCEGGVRNVGQFLDWMYARRHLRRDWSPELAKRFSPQYGPVENLTWWSREVRERELGRLGISIEDFKNLHSLDDIIDYFARLDITVHSIGGEVNLMFWKCLVLQNHERNKFLEKQNEELLKDNEIRNVADFLEWRYVMAKRDLDGVTYRRRKVLTDFGPIDMLHVVDRPERQKLLDRYEMKLSEVDSAESIVDLEERLDQHGASTTVDYDYFFDFWTSLMLSKTERAALSVSLGLEVGDHKNVGEFLDWMYSIREERMRILKMRSGGKCRSGSPEGRNAQARMYAKAKLGLKREIQAQDLAKTILNEIDAVITVCDGLCGGACSGACFVSPANPPSKTADSHYTGDVATASTKMDEFTLSPPMSRKAKKAEAKKKQQKMKKLQQKAKKQDKMAAEEKPEFEDKN